jgi:hypothetical protein
MTLGEIKRRARVALRLNPGDEVGDDPFYIQDTIVAAADRIAQATDCLFGERTCDITASVKSYCMPEFYRMETANVLDAQSNWQPLYIFDTPADADALYYSWWRNDTTADPPTCLVFDGPGAATLYPTPSVSRTAALMFEGWYKPGQTWARDGSGNALTLADSQECPLPVWAHEAVVQETIYQLAVGMVLSAANPTLNTVLPLFLANAKETRGKVERDSATHHSRSGFKIRSPFDHRR